MSTPLVEETKERLRVEEFLRQHKGKRARGHSIRNLERSHRGLTIVVGVIVDMGAYLYMGKTHWTLVLEGGTEKVHSKIIYSSVQLLDDLNQPARPASVGKALKQSEKFWQEEVAEGIAEAEKMLAKAKHCHPECSDGYCHRAYESAPLLRR